MRLIILICLAGCFVGLLVRHRTGHRHGVALVALGLVICILGSLEGRWLHREHVYSEIARDVVGREEVNVHCQRTLASYVDISGNLGYVPYSPDGSLPVDAFLRHDTCGHLASYVSHRTDPSLDEVRAVHVLTHEIMHLAGEKNESVAECKALQRNFDTATALGAAAPHAAEMANRYWRLGYPHVGDAYRNPECKPGGALDEHLANPPWVTPR